MIARGPAISQRARLLALLLGILVLGVLGQTLVIHNYLLDDFRRLEETQVRSSDRLIRLWLDNFLQPLDALARAGAAWDSTPAALAGARPEPWQEQLLAAAAQRATGLDMAVLLGADGTPRAGFAVAGDTGERRPLASGAAAVAQRHRSQRRGDAPLTGWSVTAEGLLATASRPLGPPAAPRGYLVVGRYFRANDLAALEELSGTHLSLIDGGVVPALGSVAAADELLRGGEGARALQLCRALTPALNPIRQWLCLQQQDSVYLRGKASAEDLRLATLSGFVVLILTAWLFLDRALLRRLQRLVGELGAAREGGTETLESALRTDSRRADELGQLSGGMGELLARIRSVETDLRRQQQNFRGLAESTGVAIFVVRDRIVYANPFAEVLTGYDEAELRQRGLGDLLHRNDRERIDQRLRNALAGRAPRVALDEVRGLRKNGSPYWGRVHTVSITYEGAPALLITLYDTSEQRHLEAVLAREKERLQVILASIGEGIVSLDPAGKISYLNLAAERLLGHTADTALGRSFGEVAVLSEPAGNRPLPSSVMDVVRKGEASVAANLLTPFGDTRQVEIHASRLQPLGDQSGAVVVLRDVSELRRVTQNLEHQASHDHLTGLVNRREFNRRLQEALRTCRSSGQSWALCYIDLDQFKTVNDICGHHAGDLLLQQISETLRRRVREHDTLARLGGDEFGLLLGGFAAEQAVAFANELRAAISEVRLAWSGRVFTVDASVGIAMLNHVEGNLDEALSVADATCYLAKEQGRSRVRLYRPGDVDLQRSFGHMHWAQRLKDALDGGRFALFQQALVPLAPGAGQAGACEVLLRLQENGEVISAGDFIEAAERYQMMPSIDRMVVLGVLDHLRRERGERRYFVNLSGQSIGDEGFHAFLLDAITRHGELARRITFEVTETAVISTLAKARKLMQQLRERGCSFALDDFGTGMSSFVYLKELEVQYLKIAGPFVRNMATSTLDAAIVRNFATFARQMQLQTIAEWVENDRTLRLLRDMKVDYGQGFLLDSPVPLATPPPEVAAAARPAAGAVAADWRAQFAR